MNERISIPVLYQQTIIPKQIRIYISTSHRMRDYVAEPTCCGSIASSSLATATATATCSALGLEGIALIGCRLVWR